MTDTVLFQLPGGYVNTAGTVLREVQLTALTGKEEELLAQNQALDSASMVTAVLSRCVQRLGAIAPVPVDVVRGLLIADRQYLLLKLREMTFGQRVQATVPCPWQGCKEKVDIDFSIRDIPVKESINKGPIFNMELSDDAVRQSETGGISKGIVFRLPNGGDQEALSPLLKENEARTLALLLSRCIVSIGPVVNPGLELVEKLSPAARMEIEKQMEAMAPQVETELGTQCPECGRQFSIPFNIHDFFFGELRTSVDLLYREVHYLAYHYHWGESEIMAMSRQKRHRYIAVLADEIERMNHAD